MDLANLGGVFIVLIGELFYSGNGVAFRKL